MVLLDFAEAGTKFKLTLERDGKVFIVNVTLEELDPEAKRLNPKR